jgi:DNA mismatch repair protein MutH
MLGPPRSERELLERARALAHDDLGGLADRVGRRPPPDLTRDKGWVGQLIEDALGATAANRAEPDFVALGVELKTVPVDASGRPREATFVTAAPPDALLRGDWATSAVRHKTRRILWIPVESDEAVPVAARRIGQALLWSPSATDDAAFAADWDTFCSTARAGLDRLHGRLGRVLQLRPKARDARARTTATDPEGRTVSAKPLGFYLRRSFTSAVFARAYIQGG